MHVMRKRFRQGCIVTRTCVPARYIYITGESTQSIVEAFSIHDRQ